MTGVWRASAHIWFWLSKSAQTMKLLIYFALLCTAVAESETERALREFRDTVASLTLTSEQAAWVDEVERWRQKLAAWENEMTAAEINFQKVVDELEVQSREQHRLTEKVLASINEQIAKDEDALRWRWLANNLKVAIETMTAAVLLWTGASICRELYAAIVRKRRGTASTAEIRAVAGAPKTE